MTRRAPFAKARIFLPRVTWVDSPGADGAPTRRDLDYESDVLAAIDWARFNAQGLLGEWAPAPAPTSSRGTPGSLDPHWIRLREPGVVAAGTLDRARLVRAVIDLVPNPFWAWAWVEAAVERLRKKGFDEAALAASSASMIEGLRTGIERERDRLAQACFMDLVANGRIEFALRADALDYELPFSFEFDLEGKPDLLTREDAHPVEKSLFEPFLRNGLNDFESSFACYLDDHAALEWWHRNVARRQYGLQGWKRDKVYPDFVFAVLEGEERRRVVILETKGAHLSGSEDTTYKQALLERLTAAFADRRGESRAGSLELEGGGLETRVVCDLLVDTNWRGTLEARHLQSKLPN